MMSYASSAACFFLSCSLFAGAAVSGDEIQWQASFQEALELAARDRKPVLLCVNEAGEPFSERVLAEHYQDERIVRLAGETVNLFASGGEHGPGSGPCKRCKDVTCTQHRVILAEAQKALAEALKKVKRPEKGEGEERPKGEGKGGGKGKGERKGKRKDRDEEKGPTRPKGEVVLLAPQHLFLDGSGELLFSAPHGLTSGELEWCLVEALRRLDPQFAWALSEQAKAPPHLKEKNLTQAPLEKGPLPPERKEVEELLKRLHTTGRGEWTKESREDVARLVLSEEKQAVSYVKSMLSRRNPNRKARYSLTELIHLIGKTAPDSWWQVVSPSVDDFRPEIRAEAAVALEQLAEPKSFGDLMKQWHKEKESSVKIELVRALAAVAPESKAVIKLVEDQALKGKDDSLRAYSMVAAAHLEARTSVQELARAALADKAPRIRALAAWLIAIRREQELLQVLEGAAASEVDAPAKQAMETALEVMDGAPNARLETILRAHAVSPIKRDRL